MLSLTNLEDEINSAIQESEKIRGNWNLRINTAKFQVLTEKKLAGIAAILCVTILKYLCTPLLLDLKLKEKNALLT